MSIGVVQANIVLPKGITAWLCIVLIEVIIFDGEVPSPIIIKRNSDDTDDLPPRMRLPECASHTLYPKELSTERLATFTGFSERTN